MTERENYVDYARGSNQGSVEMPGKKQTTEYRGKTIVTESFFYGSQMMHRGYIEGEKKATTLEMFRSPAICLDHFKMVVDMQLDGL